MWCGDQTFTTTQEIQGPPYISLGLHAAADTKFLPTVHIINSVHCWHAVADTLGSFHQCTASIWCIPMPGFFTIALFQLVQFQVVTFLAGWCSRTAKQQFLWCTKVFIFCHMYLNACLFGHLKVWLTLAWCSIKVFSSWVATRWRSRSGLCGTCD